MSILVTIVGAFGLAMLMGLFNGFFISYLGPPPLIMTFATSTIWFGIALYIMPTPGGHIPKVFYKAYRASIFQVLLWMLKPKHHLFEQYFLFVIHPA